VNSDHDDSRAEVNQQASQLSNTASFMSRQDILLVCFDKELREIVGCGQNLKE